jgi:REP element-mobilizing transposase RayT
MGIVEIHAWCVMSNHVHLVLEYQWSKPELLIADLKKVSQSIVKAYRKIQEKAEKISCWIF